VAIETHTHEILFRRKKSTFHAGTITRAFGELAATLILGRSFILASGAA